MFVFCFADGIYIQTTPPSEQEKREAKLIVLASSCLHFCFLIPCFLGSSKRKRKKTQGLVPSWWQLMLANFLASNIVIYIYIFLNPWCFFLFLFVSQMALVPSDDAFSVMNATVVAIDKDKNSQHAVRWAIDHLVFNNPLIVIVHVRHKNHHYRRYPPSFLFFLIKKYKISLLRYFF